MLWVVVARGIEQDGAPPLPAPVLEALEQLRRLDVLVGRVPADQLGQALRTVGGLLDRLGALSGELDAIAALKRRLGSSGA